MKAQKDGVYPALTYRQVQDQELMEKRLDEFLKGHQLGSDESAWITRFGSDAHGAMLGRLWKWCMEESNGSGMLRLSMNTLETGGSKKASMAIRKRFPRFEPQTHEVKQLLLDSRRFSSQYNNLVQKYGGSQSQVVTTTPMFLVDAKRHIESTEPTAMGVRMNATIAVLNDTGISVDQM
jgi:hypothetical protein